MIGLTAAFGVGLLAVAALANYWRRQKNQEERLRQDLQLQNTTLQQEKADMEMRLNLPKPFRDALDTTRLSRRDA
jgi:Flp pilus assembly protein TadB